MALFAALPLKTGSNPQCRIKKDLIDKGLSTIKRPKIEPPEPVKKKIEIK
jgi:hypothetical protein